jgi:hypothetical protein
MTGEFFGTYAMLGVALLAAMAVLLTRLPREIKILIVVGLVLRLAGSQFYYYLTEWVYRGIADYRLYFAWGDVWAQAYMEGWLDSLRSVYLRSWCCTGFTVRFTGVVTILLGRDINAAFLAFAMMGYGGLLALAAAYARAMPTVSLQRYLTYIVFFPSLWYWPAALGKDALMLCGLGLAVLGYVGRRGRTGWLPLGLGLTLVFMVRPQVAAVVVACMTAGFWVASGERWNVRRLVEGAALVAVCAVLISLAGNALGFPLLSIEEAGEYLESRGGMSSYGGSAVSVGAGAFAPLIGIVNVLLRPFLFEASNVPSFLAALEVTVLWVAFFWRRRDVMAFFRTQRRSKLLWFSLAFVAAFVLLTGIALGNLGLIARQRVLVFPFLLMFLAGAPGARAAAPVLARRPPMHVRARQGSTTSG